MTQGLRSEIVVGIVGALSRLAHSKHFLTQPQRFFVAEQLRDVADGLKAHGARERVSSFSRGRMAPAGAARRRWLP